MCDPLHTNSTVNMTACRFRRNFIQWAEQHVTFHKRFKIWPRINVRSGRVQWRHYKSIIGLSSYAEVTNKQNAGCNVRGLYSLALFWRFACRGVAPSGRQDSVCTACFFSVIVCWSSRISNGSHTYKLHKNGKQHQHTAQTDDKK